MKEENIHFERDEHGNIIKVIRTGDINKPKKVDPVKLEKQQKKERQKQERQHLKQMEREYKQQEAQRKAMERANKKKASQQRWKPVKTAVHTSVDVSKKTMNATRQTMNLGKMSFDNRKKQPSKKPSGQKYIIRNNIAYPIAQKKKKNKKKKEGDFNWKDFGMPSWKDMMK